MSTDTNANGPEEPLSDCVEPGCDTAASYLESRRGGYRLVCELHAGDVALDLSELDFRKLEDEDLPPSLRRLGMVANHRYTWYNKGYTRDETDEEGPLDPRTASLVVREPDGQVVGESQRYDFEGLWALVCADVPDDFDEYRRDDPPELPGWAEWVHCDAPMDHHVEAVRCSICGEENDWWNPVMPQRKARMEPWERIPHRAGCPQASELDESYWHERQLGFELKHRPSPRVMALDAIWAEIEEWDWLREHECQGHGTLDEAIEDRARLFDPVLKDRMGTRYPKCPNCETEPFRAGEHYLECNCASMPDWVDDEWWDQHRRVWGHRGQGDRGQES